MKTSVKIVCKILLLAGFLCITPFFSGINEIMNQNGFLNAFVYYQHTFDEGISIKDQMNLLSYHADFTIEDEFKFKTTQERNPQTQDSSDATTQSPSEPPHADQREEEEPVKDSGKTVYIYNTHQGEGYEGGQTVMDAAAILGNELEARGIHVVLENADFNSYLKNRGLNYNQSYQASYNYLNDALVNYGGFDLIIDLHRDAIPREASYLKVGDKQYAKMMMVIGGLSDHAEVIQKESTTLSDIIDAKVHGIMRTPMVREAYYNQQVSERMMLIECGGDVNPFEEVRGSMSVLADGIYEYLVR